MIPRIFEGQAVVIVAGGPSLIGFDFERLRGRNVIAINKAHEYLPDASVLWWSDALYYRMHKESLLGHAAPWKATCTLGYEADPRIGDLDPSVTQYMFSGLFGFDPRPAYLRHGNNSGYAALHLAAHLGARRVVLLGYDMRHDAHGRTHFHGGHSIHHREDTLVKMMLPYFKALRQPLMARDVLVFNASPESRITVWPKCTIEQGMRYVEEA